jgi:hypothetical protein
LFGCSVLGAVSAGCGATQAASTNSVSISNNGGGVVVEFALKAAEYEEAGTLVKFSGRCDSSCTLYLGLPQRQTCINPGAYFRFHSPSAKNARATRTAQAFMMQKYPDWVRNWIQVQGGLSSRLIKMDYAYASRFISSCEKLALR